MTLPEYPSALDKLYRSGKATEHSYRPDLQRLLAAMCNGVDVTNEPRRIDCGAPDYILTKNDIPVGYIEAKDIGVDMDSKSLKEQFDRYRGSLDNLIITDYLEFRFYRNGEHTTTVRIGEVSGGKVKALPAAFEQFTSLIADFVAWQGQTITSPKKLAAMMAGKARLLADVIEKAVTSDEESRANTDLKDQLEAFKHILIHDITPKAFADLYAQTIAYGMFAARLHDPSLDSFNRMEAAVLIPKSNPFLRKLFHSISGPDLDDRIVWIVDALADIFRATDIAKLLSGFGKGSGREDAFMHFYEDFLAQYDPKLRKSRGVWYTPDAVVRFIVRAVDDILKSEFGLPMGLADSSTVQIEVDTDNTDNRTSTGKRRMKKTVHRVQVLDPATGTGTFLAEVVRQVHSKFQGQEGMWPQYVEQHLIPRINGFELLMASYAMAHLKLDLVLRDTGYDMGKPHGTPGAAPKGSEQQRLRVFLTNSLEEAHPDTGTLFASWLSQEANEANAVKRDTPVMVVLGNPPYSIISSNLSEQQRAMVEKYKYIDGERVKEKGALQMEKNLNDDYVKFIALGEHLINTTGEGMLAYINNNNYLDAPTLRGMRANLLKSFSSLYILDLKGSSKKKDRTADGGKDENVFDIQQGVCINVLIKNPAQRKTKVWYASVQGDREMKYSLLQEGRVGKLQWQELRVKPPKYELIPRDYEELDKYDRGIRVTDLFPRSGTGIITARDHMVIDSSADAIAERVAFFRDSLESDSALCNALDISLKKGWDIGKARQKIKQVRDIHSLIQPISYRPFDLRKVFYHDTLLWSPVKHVMDNFFGHENVGLVTARSNKSPRVDHVFISNHMTETKCGESTTQSILVPLYLYPEATKQTAALSQGVQPNLDAKLVEQLATGIGLTYRFVANDLWAHGTGKDLMPLDVLDYCYAVLHSPAYRAKYKEFLKSDFPRIPYPTDAKKFRALVKLGARLRQLHLLEDPAVEQFITKFPANGEYYVTRKMTAKSPGWEATSGKSASGQLGRVWINDQQYFADVPEVAWNFYIGGYQPAQKWLKDRVGRQLTIDDIRHYQRMIVALTETGRVMEEVDKVGVV
jgi:predicted helicase